MTKMQYSAYAGSEFEARHGVLDACKKAPESFFCESEYSIECEQITVDHIAWACTVKNNFISQSFIGRGRGRIETEFRAKENCILSSPKEYSMDCLDPFPDCTQI